MKPNFTVDELIASDTALRLGIDNSPSEDIKDNLITLIGELEQVRHTLCDLPMVISSGYRCLELNSAVRGSKTSDHMKGWAADFRCPAYGKPLDIVKKIAMSSVVFDQLIEEGNWAHISFNPHYRREVLTAHFGQGGTTYTKGVT